MKRLLLAASCIPALTLPAIAEQHVNMEVRAEVMNRDGDSVGTVTINETASGQALIIVALSGLSEGAHGIHFHETGDCSADDFTSAGGHIAGDADHGVMVEGGPHPGDMPNIVVGSDGNTNVEIFNDRIDIADHLLDEDGAAFIVHSGPDDYMSQPSGDSGDRVACGVLEEV